MARGSLRTIRAIVVAAVVSAVSHAATEAQDLRLVGLDGRSSTLTPADIASLPHVALTVTAEGKTASYRGVPLAVLLGRVSAPLGKALKGADLRDVVLVTAQDGYAAALALAEADPMERKEQILLADEADGRPLTGSEGPYRLVIEGDLRGARLVRMVTAIELLRVSSHGDEAR